MPYVSEADYAEMLHKINEQDEQLGRAKILLGVLTVKQIVAAGEEAVKAAGIPDDRLMCEAWESAGLPEIKYVPWWIK